MSYEQEIEHTDYGMTREKALATLKELKESRDTEVAHLEADKVLWELLCDLGYTDVVDAWLEVNKWYA